jgi:hypothetical protein
MRRLIEWFFSLFVSNADIKEFTKEELERLSKEYTDYKNKQYINKLRKR